MFDFLSLETVGSGDWVIREFGDVVADYRGGGGFRKKQNPISLVPLY